MKNKRKNEKKKKVHYVKNVTMNHIFSENFVRITYDLSQMCILKIRTFICIRNISFTIKILLSLSLINKNISISTF